MSKTISICLVTLLIALTATSCKKSTDNKTMIFQVEPALTLIGANPPAPSDSPKNIPAMVLIEEGSQDTIFLTLDRIQGFDYTEGYRYTLKVMRTILKNPPADGDSYSYSLIELVSKEKVEKNIKALIKG